MRQIELSDIRQAIYDIDLETSNLSDEELLNSDLEKDLGLDSLDLMMMRMHLDDNCGVTLSDGVLRELPERGCTVKMFLETCNRYLASD